MRGFTSKGWSWYRGFWHHDGYAYKWKSGVWWRWENRVWRRYRKNLPISPKRPVGKKECRHFYKRMKPGFNPGLSEKRIPRCIVGSDVYMWKGAGNCRFLGGKLHYMARKVCKAGT